MIRKIEARKYSTCFSGGGSWSFYYYHCKVANHSYINVESRSGNLGFRVLRRDYDNYDKK